jgi:hypothetical protein
MIRSFAYSTLTEQTLEILQKVTGTRNKNQLFEPMVEAMLRSTIDRRVDLTPDDLNQCISLRDAWDQVRKAETFRTEGVH